MDAIQLPLPQPEDPLFGPIIYAYTRSQALADGVLVDVTEIAREVGFKLPVALTEALHNRLIHPRLMQTSARITKAGYGMCSGWQPSPSSWPILARIP